MVNEESFNAIVISKSDFSDNYELSKTELEFIWKIAPRKLVDFLMQDYDLCMNSFVDYALEKYAEQYKDD